MIDLRGFNQLWMWEIVVAFFLLYCSLFFVITYCNHHFYVQSTKRFVVTPCTCTRKLSLVGSENNLQYNNSMIGSVCSDRLQERKQNERGSQLKEKFHMVLPQTIQDCTSTMQSFNLLMYMVLHKPYQIVSPPCKVLNPTHVPGVTTNLVRLYLHRAKFQILFRFICVNFVCVVLCLILKLCMLIAATMGILVQVACGSFGL